MYLINRAALVLSMKQPFVDWVDSLDKHIPKFTLEAINRESHTYLISEHDTEQKLELIIQGLYREIMELELSSFCTDEDCWPEIKYEKFLEFFQVKVHSMVFDTEEEEIEGEEWQKDKLDCSSKLS